MWGPSAFDRALSRIVGPVIFKARHFTRKLLWGGMPRPQPTGEATPALPAGTPLRLRDSLRPPWNANRFQVVGDEDKDVAERYRQMFAGLGVTEMQVPAGCRVDESGNPLMEYPRFAWPKSRKLIQEFDIVIIGGGTGGLAVAQKLGGAGMGELELRLEEEGEVDNDARFHYSTLVIDPTEDHYYSPLFAQVAMGERKMEDAKANRTVILNHRRPQLGSGPVQHLPTSVVEVLPYENAVLTADGRKVTYKQLVVASGMKQNLDRVKGLREALGRAGVSATSVVPYAHRTWDFVRFFPGGKAVFAEAGGATKLADPLVLAADDYWRRYVGANLYNIKVFTGQNKLFPIPKFEKALSGLYASRGVSDVQCGANLVEVRAGEKQAVFEHANGQHSTVPFDFLHVVPPTTPHPFIAQSQLANAEGWVDVDQQTLQHKKFPNIFALGDCAALPTVKSVAATSAQAHVLVENLIRYREARPRFTWAVYDGYTATGVTVNHNSSLLAEADYSGAPRQTFPIDGATPSRLLSAIQKDLFEWAYWERVIMGKHDMAKAQYALSALQKLARA